MSDQEQKPPHPLPQREVIDPDYRGEIVGEPFHCRDPRNRKRVMPDPERAILDADAEEKYFGIDQE